jgi:hypothetical protein
MHLPALVSSGQISAYQEWNKEQDEISKEEERIQS